jgi:hypothetical protein
MAKTYPSVVVTQEMIDKAKKLIPSTRVFRTIASKIDTLTGHLGEFAFADYFYGNWRNHRVGKNKGETDFEDIEIKTSAFPFSESLNLLVREDYAQKRKPSFYVQVIIDVDSRDARDIAVGTKAYICGFASAEEVDNASKRDFGSKFKRAGGYQCHYINIKALHPMEEFAKAYESSKNER